MEVYEFYQNYIDYYGITIEHPAENIWYAPETDYYCVFEGYKVDKYRDYESVSTYLSDYKNTPLLARSRMPDFFFMLCFLAQKKHCKAPDIMELLSVDLSSREKYIEQAQKLFKLRGYLGFHVVFDGAKQCTLGKDYSKAGAYIYYIDKRDGYYECAHADERGGANHLTDIIYDETLLYTYLLNEQFYLLSDRATGDWPAPQ